MNNDLRIKNHKSSIVNHKSFPTQYQKGYTEFYKLKFKVTPDVLIPRPETELLVDYVLEFIKNHTLPNPYPLTILDLGTGSGNIAISLACNLKGCNTNIIASDISIKALKIARQNARFHKMENQITFIKSDLLNCYDTLVHHSKIAKPNIIVTNLPYIPSARIPYLDSSVKDFEPSVALDGGEDGFNLYRKLFKQLVTLGVNSDLHPRLIIGEIDYTHGELAVNEAYKFFPDAKVEVKLDLAKKQRILLIKL